MLPGRAKGSRAAVRKSELGAGRENWDPKERIGIRRSESGAQRANWDPNERIGIRQGKTSERAKGARARGGRAPCGVRVCCACVLCVCAVCVGEGTRSPAALPPRGARWPHARCVRRRGGGARVWRGWPPAMDEGRCQKRPPSRHLALSLWTRDGLRRDPWTPSRSRPFPLDEGWSQKRPKDVISPSHFLRSASDVSRTHARSRGGRLQWTRGISEPAQTPSRSHSFSSDEGRSQRRPTHAISPSQCPADSRRRQSQRRPIHAVSPSHCLSLAADESLK